MQVFIFGSKQHKFKIGKLTILSKLTDLSVTVKNSLSQTCNMGKSPKGKSRKPVIFKKLT